MADRQRRLANRNRLKRGREENGVVMERHHKRRKVNYFNLFPCFLFGVDVLIVLVELIVVFVSVLCI